MSDGERIRTMRVWCPDDGPEPVKPNWHETSPRAAALRFAELEYDAKGEPSTQVISVRDGSGVVHTVEVEAVREVSFHVRAVTRGESTEPLPPCLPWEVI